MKRRRLLGELWQDLRYAARGLRTRPAFTALVVATLALGIAANVSIFALVDTVLLRNLPVPHPEELVLFSDGRALGRVGLAQEGLTKADYGKVLLYSYPLYARLRDDLQGVKLAAQDSVVVDAIVRGHDPSNPAGDETAKGRVVTANFFDVLGIGASRGRFFSTDDERAPAANPSLVLSHGYWQRRFGGDPHILGKKLSVNSHQYTVVGVTPPGFSGATVGAATDFWVPMNMAEAFTRVASATSEQRYAWLHPFGRLEPGTSLAAVEANANGILHSSTLDASAKKQRIEILPGATGFSRMRRNFEGPLSILMAGVLLLQLIVCLNVAHLMIVRALGRQQEMSVRAALGATGARVVRQLLTEGVLLAALGAAAGLLGARWLTDALVSLASSDSGMLALNLAVIFDARALWFALALAAGTAIVLGLVPAWHAARSDLQHALRETAQATTPSGSRHRISRVLLVAQVASSLVLLVAAGLLAASLGNLRSVPLGVDSEHILVSQLGLEMAGVGDERLQLLYEDIPRRVAALPGVLGAGLSHPGPFNGRTSFYVSFPGTDLPDKVFTLYLVTPGYFHALGMRILRGRGFHSSDSRDAPRVAVVSETMAQTELGGRDAIGQRISLEKGHDVEIVGVVGDAQLRSIRRDQEPMIFLPAAQPHGMPGQLHLDSLALRATGDPLQLTREVRKAVAEAQSDLGLQNVRTLSEQVDRTLVPERLLALLASAFGLGALFLVGVGLYGVISQWATQRTRELGVRMALGASPLRVQWLVLRQALWLVLIGLGLGVPAAMAAAQLLAGLLFEVTPLDPRALIGSVLLLVAVAAAAAFIPARRVSRLDPISALRCE